jgi:rubrerythrin
MYSLEVIQAQNRQGVTYLTKYVCHKCGREIVGTDHPRKHSPVCPIATLAKKNPDGSFATR